MIPLNDTTKQLIGKYFLFVNQIAKIKFLIHEDMSFI